MIRSYKYRLYPNQEQRKLLNKTLDLHRNLYNSALAERKEEWEEHENNVTFAMQSKELKHLRKEKPKMGLLNVTSMQQTLRRLDKSFKSFFRRVKRGKDPGYPRFKGDGWYKSVNYTYGDGMRLKDERLYVQNIGSIRIFQHRPVPDNAAIKRGILKRDTIGNWFVTLSLQMPDPEPTECEFNPTGIDMGLEYFASFSSGEQIDNPRWYRKYEKKLAKLQSMRSRCTKGSRRYKELSRRLRKTHLKISNKRKDFQHKLSRKIVNKYSHVFAEDLNINSLAKSHVSKSIGDAGWRQFLNFVDYKAEKAGTQYLEVDANGTSQTCPICGGSCKKELSERTHKCNCGYVVPRDIASAQVIELRGYKDTKNRSARTESRRKKFLQSGPVSQDSVTPGADIASVAGCPLL